MPANKWDYDTYDYNYDTRLFKTAKKSRLSQGITVYGQKMRWHYHAPTDSYSFDIDKTEIKRVGPDKYLQVLEKCFRALYEKGEMDSRHAKLVFAAAREQVRDYWHTIIGIREDDPIMKTYYSNKEYYSNTYNSSTTTNKIEFNLSGLDFGPATPKIGSAVEKLFDQVETVCRAGRKILAEV